MPNDAPSQIVENDAAIQQNASTEDRAEVSKHSDQDDRQRIFDERFQLFTEAFGATCETEGVEHAVAIVYDPKIRQPIVFIRGGEYQVAQLVAGLLRDLKAHIAEQLHA